MPTYTYKARDSSGKPITGTMEAVNKDEAIEKFRKMGYAIIQITEGFSDWKKIHIFRGLFKKVNTSDMMIFTSKLSNLINAGVSILASLNTLAKQVENDILRGAILKVISDVEKGDSLSIALSKYPLIFPNIFVNMVKAGEKSGKLDEILQGFSRFLEWQVDLKQKIKGAIVYPIILLAGGLVVSIFLVSFVIPQFAEMFMALDLKMPLPTIILYKIGTGIKRFWHLGILLFAAATFAIRRYSRTESGKLFFGNLKLKMPIIGPLYRELVTSRFARTLALLTESGVPIMEALDLTKDILENEILARAIADVRRGVEKGQPIAENLEKCKKFPLDMVQMISIGEETGNLTGMLNKISDFYDRYIEYATKKFTTLIEPFFIILLGGMVGYIMGAMLIPIFEIINAVGK